MYVDQQTKSNIGYKVLLFDHHGDMYNVSTINILALCQLPHLYHILNRKQDTDLPCLETLSWKLNLASPTSLSKTCNGCWGKIVLQMFSSSFLCFNVPLFMIFRLFFDYSYVTMFSAQLSCFPIFFIVFMFSCYYVHVFSMVFKLYFNCLGNVSAAGGGEPLQAAEKRPLYKTSTPLIF